MHSARKKILNVFGTRPEAIKMGPVVQALRQYPDWFDTRVIVTGQHKEQLYQALAAYQIQPDLDLEIMQHRQTLAQIFVGAMAGLDRVFRAEQPDVVLVHGDTSTTMVATIAAFYHQIPVGHVEAGLRTYNKYSPFPEEVNRRVTDAVAEMLFAPTPLNRQNLLREGADPGAIFVTGQTEVDAARHFYRPDYTFADPKLAGVDFAAHRVIAVTAHRRENLGEPLRQMCAAMLRLVNEHPDTFLVYPVHLSPAVRDVVLPALGGHPRILLTDPVGFADMIHLIARSYMIMSDSGGLQEDAPVFGKPLVLMRDTTERPEAVTAGVVVLAGNTEAGVYGHAHRLLEDAGVYKAMAQARNPFGDGRAAARIALYLAHRFGFAPERPGEFTR